MVAYNFNKRFARHVASGLKTQTIRRTLRCKPGDDLQMYTDQRTPMCRKLIANDPICTHVHAVIIRPTGVFLDAEPLPPHTHAQFARSTGFLDITEMLDWYLKQYPDLNGEMTGYLVKWKPRPVG